jgi:RNA polymerase sigma-70 factor (ECF subfamily)
MRRCQPPDGRDRLYCEMNLQPDGEFGPGLEDRLLAGDADAFRRLVEAYKRRFYGLAYQYTRNHADAEDVSQAAFVKIHRSIGTFKKGSSLNAWLYRVVVNAAIDHIRRRPFYPEGVTRSENIGPAVGPWDPARSAEAASLRRGLEAALTRVSERERTAFLLRFDQELSLQEIAEILGVSIGSVKSYLFRSGRKLRRELSGAGWKLSQEAPHV